MRSTHGCVSDQNPQLARAVSVPLELGKKVEHVATRLGDRGAGPPSSSAPAGPGWPCGDRLLVVEKAEGFRDLYSVTWSHLGFVLQFEKNECF